MKRGRRKTENPETAQRILATAERIFAQQGLAGARTDEIAAAAHVNKAMLYYYFSSKRRLHRSVLENLFRQLRDSVYPPRTAEQSARKRLLNYVNSYFDFLVSHPNFPRLVQRAAMEAGENFAWIAKEYLCAFHRHVSRVIEDGIASGEFRKVDPHQAVLSINGLTVSYFAAAPIFSKVLGHNLLAPQALVKRREALLDFLSPRAISPGGDVRMTARKFFMLLGVLFLITALLYFFTVPRGSAIPLIGIVDGNEVIVSPQIAGRMIRLTVDEGDRVKKGQLIAELDPTELECDAGAGRGQASRAWKPG